MPRQVLDFGVKVHQNFIALPKNVQLVYVRGGPQFSAFRGGEGVKSQIRFLKCRSRQLARTPNVVIRPSWIRL